jgi:hypothetical protein
MAKETITQIYQQIATVMDSLNRRDLTIEDAQSEFRSIAAKAKKIGATIVVPTEQELQERFKQLSAFESSEEVEPVYEESYESSNCW